MLRKDGLRLNKKKKIILMEYLRNLHLESWWKPYKFVRIIGNFAEIRTGTIWIHVQSVTATQDYLWMQAPLQCLNLGSCGVNPVCMQPE
jgi:hypothetical protein